MSSSSFVYLPDLPPPPIPPPAGLKSPTHPSKTSLEARGMMSPKAGEGRDRRGGSGGGYRPREGSDPRTSSSERRETQDRQKIPRAGKGNKQEGGSTKARQHPGTENMELVAFNLVVVCSCSVV